MLLLIAPVVVAIAVVAHDLQLAVVAVVDVAAVVVVAVVAVVVVLLVAVDSATTKTMT